MSILLVVGTRPELIKMAPVAIELIRRGHRDQYVILNTAQHRELLDPYWKIFDLQPDFVLDVMQTNSSLSKLTARALDQVQGFIDSCALKPSIVVAQGDTTTVMVASMIAFYNHMKFIHLEAGLRSFDLGNPFPEEFNRKVAAITCQLHLAPTTRAEHNLLQEGYNEKEIKVVGNTIVDALHYIRKLPEFAENTYLKSLDTDFKNKRIALVTCHRRENHGGNLTAIINAVKTLAIEFSNYLFIWPIHPNPNVMDAVKEAFPESFLNVKIVAPLDYIDMLSVMSKCTVIISDSGGVQEEAPSFNVPVLVLREKTERPEGVEIGIAHLVGADGEKIISTFKQLDKTTKTVITNPYGDGGAAGRIVDLLLDHLK